MCQKPVRTKTNIHNKNRKALIIEDDVAFRRAMRRALRTTGFDVSSAVNVKEGLDLWQASLQSDKPYDLICTDFDVSVSANHGCFDGLDFIRRTINCTSDQIIIVVSGSLIGNDSGLKDQLIKEGADDVIIKPSSFDEIISKIRKYFPK
jgi:ActR/RegA family two-component response regulator